MKIIYVENVRIPSERAHAYQIVQTCAWFAREEHEVILVNPDRAGDKDVFSAFHLEKDLFQHVRLPVFDPLAWEWFPLKKLAYAIQRFSFARKVKAWAKAQKADVWYTRDPAMVDVLRDDSRRFALELHDRPDYSVARWNRVKSHVASFITITRGLADELVRLGIKEDQIRVAPDGYDPEEFQALGNRSEERRKLGIPESAFVAIYTGSFYAWKGVDLVVRAWKNVKDADTHLVLVGGPDSDRRRLEALVDPVVASRVHIFPTKPRQEAIRMLAAGNVGLLTTSDAQSIGKFYTSPLKQFEYLAAGLPILASDVPSSHEILTENLATFFPLTEEDFVEMLGEAKADEAWRSAASESAKRAVLGYTWQIRAQRILNHINPTT